MSENWRDNLKFKIKKLEKGDTFYTCDGYKNHIIDIEWGGVNLHHESQKEAPYITDSIQYYFAKLMESKYEYVIDDDIIDQAIVYMHANDIFICQYTMNITCKDILLHKINYSEETLKTKEEMIEDIKEAKLLQASIFEELQNLPNIQAYWETYQKNRELIIQAIIQEKKATRKIKK